MQQMKTAADKHEFENEHALVSVELRGQTMQLPFCVQPTEVVLPIDESISTWLWEWLADASQQERVPGKQQADNPPSGWAVLAQAQQVLLPESSRGRMEEV